MIEAASVSLELNLLAFSHYLSSQGIAHSINERSGQQVIWVANESHAELVRQALNQPDFEESLHASNQREQAARPKSNFLGSLQKHSRSLRRQFIQSPCTFLLIAACLIVALVSQLGVQLQQVSFLFYPVLSSQDILSLLGDIDTPAKLLRTLTPMFLHFGELHLIFNMLWLAYFGKQLESIHGSAGFALMVVVAAFVSNSCQYLVSDANNFGGMSGVVYALVGFAWVAKTTINKYPLMITNSMFGFFLVALVMMEVLASSWIASAAHAGGLAAGLLMGLSVALMKRIKSN